MKEGTGITLSTTFSCEWVEEITPSVDFLFWVFFWMAPWAFLGVFTLGFLAWDFPLRLGVFTLLLHEGLLGPVGQILLVLGILHGSLLLDLSSLKFLGDFLQFLLHLLDLIFVHHIGRRILTGEIFLPNLLPSFIFLLS